MSRGKSLTRELSEQTTVIWNSRQSPTCPSLPYLNEVCVYFMTRRSLECSFLMKHVNVCSRTCHEHPLLGTRCHWLAFGGCACGLFSVQYFVTLCLMTGTAVDILNNRWCLVRAVALIAEAVFCSVRVWGHDTEKQFMYAHITCTLGFCFLTTTFSW